MLELETSQREIILIYVSDTVRGKKTLAYSKTKELPVREIDLLKDKLTEEQVAEIAAKLKLPIAGLVDQEAPYFKTHFSHLDLSDTDWLTLIQKNPLILKQPIGIHGDRVVLVETPTDILKL